MMDWNWIRRNWLLIPVVILVGVMLIKGLGGLLPELPHIAIPDVDTTNVVWSWITAKDNLYEKLLVGVVLIIAGFVFRGLRSENTKNLVFPKILMSVGYVVIIAALLSTGTGELSKSIVQSVDTAASCSADPSQEKCKKRQEEKQAEAAAEAEKQRLAAMARQQLSAPQVVYPTRLGSESYEVKEFGSFKQIPIAAGEIVGPINMYEGSCLYFIRTGLGSLQVLSRPDFTSEVVPAKMGDNGVSVVAWGHTGKPYQLFLKAEKNPIKIELERRRGDSSCT